MTTTTDVTTQVYRVYIRATPQAIWDAITQPEWTERYGYGGKAFFDLQPGGEFRAHASDLMKAHGLPDLMVVGEVLESDPPRRLVQTWRPVWDEQIAAETASRLTYELEQEAGRDGVTRLTVTHELEGAPLAAAMVSGQVEEAGGGWAFILSDLKSLLETGSGVVG
jgi:uncharacterized protein YndB with AHSA1/START domain